MNGIYTILLLIVSNIFMTFGNCTNLQHITFLGRVDTIHPMALHKCDNLQELRIPKGTKWHYRRVLDRNNMSEYKDMLVEQKRKR